MSDDIAETRGFAAQLFNEVKRYLVLCELSTGTAMGMYSGLVDAAWHIFILFTEQYIAYSNTYFDRYLHHAPKLAESKRNTLSTAGCSKIDNKSSRAVNFASIPNTENNFSFKNFTRKYEYVFEERLPDLWYDERCITLNRRMVVDHRVGPLKTKCQGGYAELYRGEFACIIRVNELAYPALRRIQAGGSFYARELPGELTAEEKIALVEATVRTGILRIAS
ncbi:hypothetical protein [Mycobacterium marinum]|uniref:hypothetical protein n=1 Tax=Mycobacterium marinum TaxID=1781 RepID=UPI0019234107|nr:hypothetical protein [Mycobacterium marinum]QQW35650.1 hypothetical protein HXW97_18780 [Mycobacterium marinum]